MSSVSAQGLGTLLALIFAGPIIYLVRFLYKKFIRGGYGETRPSTEVVESEPEMGYSAFVFALVGYAIGIGNVVKVSSCNSFFLLLLGSRQSQLT